MIDMSRHCSVVLPNLHFIAYSRARNMNLSSCSPLSGLSVQKMFRSMESWCLGAKYSSSLSRAVLYGSMLLATSSSTFAPGIFSKASWISGPALASSRNLSLVLSFSPLAAYDYVLEIPLPSNPFCTDLVVRERLEGERCFFPLLLVKNIQYFKFVRFNSFCPTVEEPYLPFPTCY